MSERTPSAFLHNVSRLPLFLLAFGASALSMFVPAFYALSLEEHQEAQAFGYTAILGFVLFAMIGIAMAGRRPRHGTLGPLLSLFSVMVILPVFLAFLGNLQKSRSTKAGTSGTRMLDRKLHPCSNSRIFLPSSRNVGTSKVKRWNGE